jgi:septal ring factor EnvC (AmiA/AmiB activator)
LPSVNYSSGDADPLTPAFATLAPGPLIAASIPDYMDDKEKIADLQKQIQSLQLRLNQSNKKIQTLQNELKKQFRFSHDYLPYDEDERRN